MIVGKWLVASGVDKLSMNEPVEDKEKLDE
jgi:hypothetical protein